MIPIITNDAIVFSILMGILGLVFYTSSHPHPAFQRFYSYVPALLLCYMLPAIFNSMGVIGSHWETTAADGSVVQHGSKLYGVAKDYMLPAALVLMTLSIDFKGIVNLGPKSIIMFLTGTVGIILGGPFAVLVVSTFSPETVGGQGFDAVWRGLSTLAGSWIGGGANQAAMLEIYQYNQAKYGAMVLVDIVVANIWMAFLLYGAARTKAIDKWLKADTSSIDTLRERIESFANKVARMPTLRDFMVILGIAFLAVGLSHAVADAVQSYIAAYAAEWKDSMLNSGFFWVVVVATTLGLLFSFTRLRNLEGAGASKVGSVFVYILVATIGMKMDLLSVLEQPGLMLVGMIWMAFHVVLLFAVAKWIRAPFFFLAVGSKANVGGAASAPVVAAAFHPCLAPVGVLLAVLGYALGTYGALISAMLMEGVAP